MAEDCGTSRSGVRLITYKQSNEFSFAVGDSENMEAIVGHIKRHLGNEADVLHEIVSDQVHIDVHVIEPTAERNFYTLVTTGMSDRAMVIPGDDEHKWYAELLLCLPPTWPLTTKAFIDERNYWPIRWLKILARLPHQYNTWLWHGHTVPNGSQAKPFARNTKFCCMMLATPVTTPDGFDCLEISKEKTVHFFAVIPLYKEEMNYKLQIDSEGLFKRLSDAGVTELIDLKRPNVCR